MRKDRQTYPPRIKRGRRIGILGGTFNPIHLGHLVLAEQARESLHLEKVIFVPTNLPPHKKIRALATAQQRYQMAALALKSNPRFEVSDLELARGGVSYSAQTLKELKFALPQSNLFFIVGSDFLWYRKVYRIPLRKSLKSYRGAIFLKEFLGWKDIDEINKICKFAVAQRPGYPFKNLPDMQAINIAALNISSTDIRKRIKANKSIRYLVPEEVRTYILRKGLYQ